MLNPRQVANFLNENIKDGIVYSEKSIQKLIWELLGTRYFIDPLHEVIVDTCWSLDQDTKYPWTLFKMVHFKDLYKSAIVELPTPGEKQAKREIDVVDLFYRMYTGRIIPLVPLEPSSGGSGSKDSKANLLSEEAINSNTTNTVTNLNKPAVSIIPTSSNSATNSTSSGKRSGYAGYG